MTETWLGDADASANDERRRASRALSIALIAGTTTQALFWNASTGLNFFVWDLVLIAASIAAFRRGSIPRAAWGAIGVAALLGFSIVRYASDWTLCIAVPSTVVVLCALPLLLRDRLGLDGLANVPWRLFTSLRRAPRATIEAARMPAKAFGSPGTAALRRVVAGLALGAPTAGVFVLLLSSDHDFARALARVRGELGEGALFVLFSLLTAGGYLVAHALHANEVTLTRPEPEFREPTAPAFDLAAPNSAAPYRTVELSAGAKPLRKGLSPITWAMVIGQVALVFGIFVAANLRHLFGGHAIVQRESGLTYASYLHAGFAELLAATMLSVCLVLGGHAILRPRGAPRRSAVPGGGALAAIEGALLVLTTIALASCWQRLAVYEDAYGASHLRLGVALVALAVFGVLVLTLAKVVLRGWTGYGGAVLAFAAALAVFASWINADAYVARTNLDRAARGKPLDVEYLASLTKDARSALEHPVVRADPALWAQLEERFCGVRAEPLRSFRGLGACPSRTW
jgi:hypothetical protein